LAAFFAARGAKRITLARACQSMGGLQKRRERNRRLEPPD
jgi:hypothetical protein